MADTLAALRILPLFLPDSALPPVEAENHRGLHSRLTTAGA